MESVELSTLLYLLLAGVSIIGIWISGSIFEKKKGILKPYTIQEPKILYIFGIWVFFYFISLGTEFLGHIIGIWTWTNIYYIFIHAAWWWANLLTISVLFLSSLTPLLRYLVLLGWVLLFEYLQEALIHWVTHFPLVGIPYITITIVMGIVCSVSFFALDILIKLKLMENKE
jgi:hypothetical protein